MPEPWVLVLFGLSAARITGLIAMDEITRPPREAFLRRLNEKRRTHQLLATLATCPWCVSIHVCAVLAPLFWWHGHRPAVAVPALALSGSQIVGMTAHIGRPRDED